MRVVLNRADAHLRHLVQQVLTEVFPDRSVLLDRDNTDSESTDLVIWNYQPGDRVPAISRDATSRPVTVFIVDRKHVRELEAAVGGGPANIIASPVDEGALSSFLRAACSGRGANDSVSPLESMRRERDDLLQALMQANVRLQEYDRDKTNFLTRAVHDLRAPLSALTGYCGLLLSGQLGALSEAQHNVLVRMRESAVHLAELSEGMLDLSAGLRSDREPVLQDLDLRRCVQRAIEKIQPLIEEKSIDVSVDLAAPEGVLLVDPSRLEQVCTTLVDNACRNSPRGGYIEISGYSFHADYCIDRDTSRASVHESESPNCYRVDFRDAGPEVNTPPLTDIFGEHVSSSAGYGRSGSGLGLATCRMIIAQHGGNIWAENSDLGTLFSFVLPFAASHVAHSATAAYA